MLKEDRVRFGEGSKGGRAASAARSAFCESEHKMSARNAQKKLAGHSEPAARFAVGPLAPFLAASLSYLD